MANKIQLRRGQKSKLPTLSAGEPSFTTDTREFFIGTGSGNVNMGGSQWYTGTAMSGTSTTTGAHSYSACPQVKVGDIYLNTTYGYVYQCTTAGSATAAKWTYKGSIKGEQGEEGKISQLQVVKLAEFLVSVMSAPDNEVCIGASINQGKYLTEPGVPKTVYCINAKELPAGCTMGTLYDDGIDTCHPIEGELIAYQNFTDFFTNATYHRCVHIHSGAFHIIDDWWQN